MRVLEVCAGIGGFSLAAEWMGWEVAGHVEIDPFCTRVLTHHWPDVPHVNDIYEVRGDEFGPIDLLCGGIPCQPFSVAGKQQGERDPRHLWPEFFRLVLVLRPRWVVVENVSGFVRLALDACWADLESAGYTCGAALLPACGVDAPHIRQRIWLVAHPRRGRCNGVTDASRRHHPNGHDPGWSQETGWLEQCGGDAPHPTPRGLRRGRASGQAGHPACLREDAADAGNDGPQAAFKSSSFSAAIPTVGSNCGVYASDEAQSRLGVAHDGAAGRMARYLDPRWQGDPMSAFGADWEDGIPRVTAGCENRVAKLKALGNALVPQVALQVFRTIATQDAS